MNYIVRDPFESTTQTLFRSTGVNGVYGRTALFEKVVDGLSGLITVIANATRRSCDFLR